MDPTRSLTVAARSRIGHNHRCRESGAPASGGPASSGPDYVELAALSNFSLLTGASHPDELVRRAGELGLAGLALTDQHSLAGVVRGHVAAKRCGLAFYVGTRLELQTAAGPPICLLAYPTDLPSYGRLCRLLTVGKRRAVKGQCQLELEDWLEHEAGLVGVLLGPSGSEIRPWLETLPPLLSAMRGQDRLSLAITRGFFQNDAAEIRSRVDLAQQLGLPLVAINEAQMHDRARQPLRDVLDCIRTGQCLEQLGRARQPHGERRLQPGQVVHRLLEQVSSTAVADRAVARTLEIAHQLEGFSLDQLAYEYPEEVYPTGMRPIDHLRNLTQDGARLRYPSGVPEAVQRRIDHELSLIEELNYPAYFLTVHDLVSFARGRGILCQGRGSAANSAVCYCLGVTSVDPTKVDLLFERFVSRQRNEPPDIDVDFEHERREEVIQYIYRKYGRNRAALTAEVITYRTRSAIRDVGKALGLSLDKVDRLAKEHYAWDESWSEATPGQTMSDRLAQAFHQVGVQPESKLARWLVHLVQEIRGFPRHLSQHVGGFVISQRPLCEMVPIENAAMADRTVIEWDKDDIEAVGMLKVDVLGLGMLTCVRKGFELVNQLQPEKPPIRDMADLPSEDPGVYDMICRADTVGVFQIESRAQMSMLPRLRPRCYYDLVIEVAIVRPGPIQGDMVHPYLRRRDGLEPIETSTPEVDRVLSRTLGVPLFQEQAMQLAIVAAGFTPDEADQLRRAIAAWKTKSNVIFELGQRLVEGMVEHGLDRGFAERCFRQIQGFSEYGFPESHAASFALIVYASAWLKHHHPAAFAAALLNSQPMGFYAPAQIIQDAARHHVKVLPADVNHSHWDCTLSPDEGDDPSGSPALRLGLRLVKGLGPSQGQAISRARAEHGPFQRLEQLQTQAGLAPGAIRALAEADALYSLGFDRRQALWQALALSRDDLPLFDQPQTQPDEPPEDLPQSDELDRVMQDYASMGLTLREHPMSFLRQKLDGRGVLRAADLLDRRRIDPGEALSVAGLVIMRQRPSTAKGVVFITLEDETGIANLVLYKHIFERDLRLANRSRVLRAIGRLQRTETPVEVSTHAVVHLVVDRLISLDGELSELITRSRDYR